jgi:hypothetical protein
MTRDDIIRMAREAGLPLAWISEKGVIQWEQLERFAALIATAKDAEHQQTLALQQRAYEREIEIEVEAEREACAKVCEQMPELEHGWRVNLPNDCAAAIRARSNT